MEEEHRKLIRDAVLDEAAFVRATFSGRQRGHTVPWQRVNLRPVIVRDSLHLQFSFFDGQQDTTKNWRGPEARTQLDSLLDLPFNSIYVETTRQRLQVQITRRGKVIVHRHDPLPGAGDVPLDHDRQKDLLFPVGQPDNFLEQIGVATPEGKVRPGMRRKFRQVNEFLKLILEATELTDTSQSPLRVVDCGCGSAHLTFSVYHYLNHRLGIPTEVVGIDVKKGLLERLAEQVQEWGWEGLRFEATQILEYQPAERPTIVIALHACDTATDEAIAQAVRWESRLILCAPCCHHHLQQQMSPAAVPPEYHLVARYGALRQRLGDLLTDGLRAQILRILGYRADIVEFISSEHTAKNLMIRAVRSGTPGGSRALAEYRALVGRWHVRPFLAELLQQELAEHGIKPSA